MNKIRILPLLVLVAFFTFVLRLGEFVTDVRQLDAASFAADAPAKSASEKPESLEMAAATAATSSEDDKVEQAEQNNVPLGERWSDPSAIDLNFSGDSDAIIQELMVRGKELDARERQLKQKEALLKATEAQVDQKLGELKVLREDLRSLLDQQGKEEAGQIKSLVKIYEGMKPKEAAGIFNTLDMEIMLSVVSRMSERKSAPILAAMDPDKARALTVLLAQQKQLPNSSYLQ